jgi:neprilysin
MVTVINLLGADENLAKQATEEIIDFEIQLANITSSPEERSNVSILYKRTTLEQLHNEIPQIDWQRYLQIVLERPIQMSEVVVIFANDYMENLVKLISKSDSKTIANYLLWRFVRHRVNNLDDRFLEAKQKFYYVLFGREKSPPRWKNCVNQVNSNLGMAVGAMFVRKYFDENSKKDTLTMTHELQQAFREILNATDWIDPQTKFLAELKVNAMSLKIGYPDFILTKEELNKKYKDLDIHPDKYFENTLNVLRHLTRTEQLKLGELVNKTIWNTAPAVVNAYYSRNKNQIMFPAGILQPPFYHRYFPKSLNYGGIGVVIGEWTRCSCDIQFYFFLPKRT